MASVLVHIELAAGQPLAASLEALGAARRIASELGATLYAHAAIADDVENPNLAADLAEQLGGYGADKVVVSNGLVDPTPTWETDGAGLCRAADDLRPNITLLSATTLGRELGPRLAAHLGAAYVAEPSVESGARGKLVFSRELYARTYRRRLSGDDLGHPLVATITPGTQATARGLDEADLMFVPGAQADQRGLRYLRTTPLAHAELAHSRTLVSVGGGVHRDLMPLVEKLATTLGASIVGTRAARLRGLIAPEAEVGIDARCMAPQLYVCLGASGSAAHLGALTRSTEIVAIDHDREAPIFRVANYGLVGELAEVLPRLIELFEASAAKGAT